MTTTLNLPELLTPAQVAKAFAVDPKTVTRWAKAGKLPPAVVTLGGHRRWKRREIEALLNRDSNQ